jgi:Fe-S cluster assembly ATP-binding protein
MFRLEKLSVSVDSTPILSQISLSLPKGEIMALLGPNGSGKSTLALALAGHPAYAVSGQAFLDDRDLLTLPPEERAAAGLFLAFQHPPAIPGLSLMHVTRLALAAQQKQRQEKPRPYAEFLRGFRSAVQQVGLEKELADRPLSQGLSGGEQKRAELVQLLLLKPKVIILDEIDSGLDIDGLKMVGEILTFAYHEWAPSVLLISHQPTLIRQLQPTKVTILRAGSVEKEGDITLLDQVEQHGFQG